MTRGRACAQRQSPAHLPLARDTARRAGGYTGTVRDRRSARRRSERSANVAGLIKELGIVESGTDVRARKEWRQPKKIVLLGGDPGTRAQRDAFHGAGAEAEVVVGDERCGRGARRRRTRTSSSGSPAIRESASPRSSTARRSCAGFSRCLQASSAASLFPASRAAICW